VPAPEGDGLTETWSRRLFHHKRRHCQILQGPTEYPRDRPSGCGGRSFTKPGGSLILRPACERLDLFRRLHWHL